MQTSIKKYGRLGFQLEVQSPFIVCFHHKDLFPTGDGKLAPSTYLKTRIKGNDFEANAPYRMYHGDQIPGFPYHPHRGFETITVVTEGFIDHADGLKLSGRYGNGDVQWMTAGKGLQHSEMFPVLDTEKPNPLELFQIWLNLPKKSKMVDPYYNILWNEAIPVVAHKDENGLNTTLTIINGSYGATQSINANPDSYAYDPKNHVNIWLLELEPHASFVLPKGSPTRNRALYLYEGNGITLDTQAFTNMTYFFLQADQTTTLQNGDETSHLLLLEGEPLEEPVVAYGPFVMNTKKEIAQAYEDYQRTQFGGWPWESPEPVFAADAGRFAVYAGGRIEYPPTK